MKIKDNKFVYIRRLAEYLAKQNRPKYKQLKMDFMYLNKKEKEKEKKEEKYKEKNKEICATPVECDAVIILSNTHCK